MVTAIRDRLLAYLRQHLVAAAMVFELCREAHAQAERDLRVRLEEASAAVTAMAVAGFPTTQRDRAAYLAHLKTAMAALNGLTPDAGAR